MRSFRLMTRDGDVDDRGISGFSQFSETRFELYISLYPRILPSRDTFELKGTSQPPYLMSACILVLGDARMSRISMHPLRVTSTSLSLAYLHSIYAPARCTCTRCCLAERKGSRLSFPSFETPGDGRSVLHTLIFDAAGILMRHPPPSSRVQGYRR